MVICQIIDFYRCLDTFSINDAYDLYEDENENEEIEEDVIDLLDTYDKTTLYQKEVMDKLAFSFGMLIKIFGKTKDNKSICINVRNFKPFFYIKVPDKWKTTNELDCIQFIDKMKSKVYHKYQKNLLHYEIIQRKPFSHFTGGDNTKFSFLKLTFLNKETFDKYKLCLQKHFPMYTQYESNIEPILKFIHQRELNPTGWIEVKNYKHIHKHSDTRTSKTDLEITVESANDIYPLDINENVPYKIASFDIEADSSHGDFPIAIKDYSKLAQELITIYDDKILLKDKEIKSIEYILELVFNDEFNNNSIHPVKTKNFIKPSKATLEYVSYTINQILKYNFEDFIPQNLFALFENNFPPLDQTIDLQSHIQSNYIQLANEIYTYIKQQIDTNNNCSFKSILFCLSMAFQKMNNCYSVNKVYTKSNKKPDKEVFNFISPSIYQILKDVDNNNNNNNNNEPENEEENDTNTNINTNTRIYKLTKLLDKHLPSVEGDKLIQIGTTINKLGESDCYFKQIFCLGEVTESDSESTTKFVSCKDEKEVLLKWKDFIVELDPDIVIGYNIFGFDFSFLFQRAKELDCVHEFCQLGRIKDMCMNEEAQYLIEQKLSSSALGENILTYIICTGRILIDIYKNVQKDYNLDSYKLDFVAEKFLKQRKNDLPPKQIFIKQKGTNDDRREIAEYCLQDCALCNHLATKLEIVSNNLAMGRVCKVPLSYLFLRGQGVKIFSLVAEYCEKKDYLIPTISKKRININDDDSSEDDEDTYEGAIVLDPEKKIHFEPIAVSDFNSLYPSSMISENLSHDTFVEIGGRYDNLPEFDYVNIEYDIYNYISEKKSDGTLKKQKRKIKNGIQVCRYAQYRENDPITNKLRKGILPTILQNLLSARKSAKKMMEKEEDPFKQKIWNGLQLAYKVTANSLYGQCGASTSPICKKEIAASTTAVGRQMIMFSKNYVETEYKDKIIYLETLQKKVHVKDTYCVYGDTDSIFQKYTIYEINEIDEGTQTKLEGLDAIFASMEICMRTSSEISKQLKPPQNLDFEKVIYPFILISKKRYHGHYYTKMNNPSFYPNSMGIVLKRRDNAKIVKIVFGGMIDIIMNEHDIDKAWDFVVNEISKIMNGEYPIEFFIVSKTLRGWYKNPTQIAHNVLAKRQALRDPGNKFQSNDRVPYVYIVHPDSEKKGVKILQGDRIETPQFIKENNLQIDYKMYITNQILIPVSQIFQLSDKFKNIDVEKKLIDIVQRHILHKKGYKNIKTFMYQDTYNPAHITSYC